MPTTPFVLQKPRYTGSITVPDDYAFGNIERAVISVVGSAQRARVTIWSFDEVADGQRGKQIDILRNVTIDEDGNDLVLTGESLRMLREQKLRENTVTFRLTRNGKCAGCGYS